MFGEKRIKYDKKTIILEKIKTFFTKIIII